MSQAVEADASSSSGLAAWVTQQDLNMSGNGLGPGVDEFLLSEVYNSDTGGFFSDPMWYVGNHTLGTHLKAYSTGNPCSLMDLYRRHQ